MITQEVHPKIVINVDDNTSTHQTVVSKDHAIDKELLPTHITRQVILQLSYGVTRHH